MRVDTLGRLSGPFQKECIFCDFYCFPGHYASSLTKSTLEVKNASKGRNSFHLEYM